MRLFTRLMSMVLLVAGTFSTTLLSGGAAQDDPLAGSTVEILGVMEPVTTPGMNLVLMRMTMEPGATVPLHAHAGPVLLFVESGVFVVEFMDGTGVLTRADGVTETIELGTAVTLNPGDKLAFNETEGHSMAGGHTMTGGHTMVSGGDESLVLLISALVAADQPGFVFYEGTPEAGEGG